MQPAPTRPVVVADGGGGTGQAGMDAPAGSVAAGGGVVGNLPTGGASGEREKPPTAGEAGSSNGEGGRPAAVGGSGGIVAAQGGMGGAGVPAAHGGSGGSTAPVERVLWSQAFTAAIHSPAAYGGYQSATMGLYLDAGQGCRFGFSGAASGSSQTFPTDGKCITAATSRYGGGQIYDSDGMNPRGVGGHAELTGWTEATTGHTVTALRRTQTYTVILLGSADMTWNYADFTGTWEALGY